MGKIIGKTRTNQPVEKLAGFDEEVNNLPKDFTTLVDSQGHKRFIEGDINIPEMEDIDITFAKWSLSGTHLMIVIAGVSNKANAVFSNSSFSLSNLPEWIFNKIIPIFRTDYVDRKTFAASADEDLSTTNISTNLRKTSTQILIGLFNATTIAKISGFRIVFDLLIDNE